MSAPATGRRAESARPRLAVVGIVLGVAAAAWCAVALTHDLTHHTGGPPGHAPFHDSAMHATAPAGPATLGLAAGGWALMVVAMMLPLTIPLLDTLRTVYRGARLLLVVAVAAYVAVWLGVGVVLVGGAAVVGALTSPLDPDLVSRLGGLLVVIAGLYQFSPAKDACLTACRSPRWFVLRFWHGRRPVAEAATLAAAYGLSCVGCCWALMLLSATAGWASLPAMVALTAAMTTERFVPRVRVLTRALGMALVALGLATLAGAPLF